MQCPLASATVDSVIEDPPLASVRRRRSRQWIRVAEVVVVVVLIGGIVGFIPVMTFNAGTDPGLPTATSQLMTAQSDALLAAARNDSSIQGLVSIPEHVNSGATDPARACGPAAAATVIAAWQPQHNTPGNPAADVRRLESADGPDVEYGVFGTSPQREQAMLTGAGLRSAWGSGEAEMLAYVKAGYPVIVLQDVGPSWGALGLHWSVVYGYDSTDIYLTNWNGSDGHDKLSYAIFARGWTDGILMRGSGVAGRFLVVLGPQ